MLLAHPSLFADVKEKISPQNFDVPALERVAQAVFRTLSKKTRASIQTICSAVEDPQLAGLITTLEHEVQKKATSPNGWQTP